MIGPGVLMLILRELEHQAVSATADERAALYARFLEHYVLLQARGESTAVPYPGVTEGLTTPAAADIKLAVVTNKQQHLAESSLAHAGLRDYVGPVVGGDSCSDRKPHPESLLHTCRLLEVLPTSTVMIGDSVNDVLAARAALIPVLCVPYGYNEGEDSRTLPCDGFLETLADLPGITGIDPMVATA